MDVNAKMIAHAMDIVQQRQEQHVMINTGKEPVAEIELLDTSNGDVAHVTTAVDEGFFLKEAWYEILSCLFTITRTITQLFLDIALCLEYYTNNHMTWFALTLAIMISSNVICCFWMLSIEYGSKKFKDIKVLIDSETKETGIINNVRKRIKNYCRCLNTESIGVVKTFYHVLPNYRVFYFEDDPGKVYNITLPKPPSHLSLKCNSWSLGLLAVIGQLPTRFEVQYLQLRRAALISLKRNGNEYHKKMVKCVFLKNILQIVLIIGYGERLLQLFVQLYIVTEANTISPLQLTQICLGITTMLFSSVYVQTICSFINRNLWENGLNSYIGTLMTYLAVMVLAMISLLTIFIYSAISEDPVLAFISLPIFLVFASLHFTRGIFLKSRRFLVRIAKVLFWVLIFIFVYSDVHWYRSMIHYNGKSTLTSSNETKTDLVICNGAPFWVENNATFVVSSNTSLGWWFAEPFTCLSLSYYDLFFVFNVFPYIILLLAFITPMHKGFEYYHDYKPAIHPGDSKRNDYTDDMIQYYKELERSLAANNIPAIIVRARK